MTINISRPVSIILIYIDGHFFNEAFIMIDTFIHQIHGSITEKLNMFNLSKPCIVPFLFATDYSHQFEYHIIGKHMMVFSGVVISNKREGYVN